MNGAAALLVNEGDKVIVASFAAYDERDLEAYAPVVVHVDDANEIAKVDSHPEVLLDAPLASESSEPTAVAMEDSDERPPDESRRSRARARRGLRRARPPPGDPPRARRDEAPRASRS